MNYKKDPQQSVIKQAIIRGVSVSFMHIILHFGKPWWVRKQHVNLSNFIVNTVVVNYQ